MFMAHTRRRGAVPEPTTFMEYCSDVLAPGEANNGNPISNVDIDEESRKGRDRVYNLLTDVPLQVSWARHTFLPKYAERRMGSCEHCKETNLWLRS